MPQPLTFILIVALQVGLFPAEPVVAQNSLHDLSSGVVSCETQAIPARIVSVVDSRWNNRAKYVLSHEALNHCFFAGPPAMEHQTEAAAHFMDILGQAAQSHLTGKPSTRGIYKAQLLLILRNEVPDAEKLFVWAIANEVWNVLDTSLVMISAEQFCLTVYVLTEKRYQQLAHDFIVLHEKVLDIPEVYRVLFQGKPLDPEKIWRVRTPNDEVFMLEACHEIRKAVLFGMSDARQWIKPVGSWQTKKDNVIAVGMENGKKAHGRYDASAFISGGIPLMLDPPALPSSPMIRDALMLFLDWQRRNVKASFTADDVAKALGQEGTAKIYPLLKALEETTLLAVDRTTVPVRYFLEATKAQRILADAELEKMLLQLPFLEKRGLYRDHPAMERRAVSALFDDQELHAQALTQVVSEWKKNWQLFEESEEVIGQKRVITLDLSLAQRVGKSEITVVFKACSPTVALLKQALLIGSWVLRRRFFWLKINKTIPADEVIIHQNDNVSLTNRERRIVPGVSFEERTFYVDIFRQLYPQASAVLEQYSPWFHGVLAARALDLIDPLVAWLLLRGWGDSHPSDASELVDAQRAIAALYLIQSGATVAEAVALKQVGNLAWPQITKKIHAMVRRKGIFIQVVQGQVERPILTAWRRILEQGKETAVWNALLGREAPNNVSKFLPMQS